MHKAGLTYRILAMTLALVIFFSSTGYAIDLHYCKGELKSYRFNGKAKSCHELALTTHCQMIKQSCQHHGDDGVSTDNNGCCDNETSYVNGLDEDIAFSTVADLDLTKSQVQFCTAFISTLLSEYKSAVQSPAYLFYKPPLIHRDIQILYQTFLL